MSRIHNFSAGPAVLPESVLRQAQEALWDFQGSGLGLLEISHRSALFDAVVVSARLRLARLLGVEGTHHILFLQGGASSQFFMVAMNLLRGGRATYLDTGRWSDKAIAEARRYGTVDVPFQSTEAVPDANTWGDLPEGTRYLHYTSNNTVAGSQYPYVPQADVPVIVDCSSDILARPSDAASHSLMFAGAQKNLGPSGLTVVALRNDLVEHCDPDLPTMLSYRTHVAKESMFNTPPTFAIYVVERVCAWIEDNGGLSAMGAKNQAQADQVYGAIDATDFWQGKVARASRSIMNPTFTTGDPDLDTRFWKAAAEVGLNGLKGHKSVGGLRASLYNALPDAAVDALVDFMREFERTHG